MILILGGTGEAAALAGALAGRVRVVTSLAGRTKAVSLPGETRVGGFATARALEAYVREEGVVALVDATHPFAVRISAIAEEAAHSAGVPLLRLQRPGWTAGPDDLWHRVPDMAAAVQVLRGLGRRVLATTGHLDADLLGSSGLVVWLRCIEAPALTGVHVLLDRGPFSFDAELALLRAHAFDVLLTKDSGGEATRAKLDAARTLELPVVMIDRPVISSAAPGAQMVSSLADAFTWVERHLG